MEAIRKSVLIQGAMQHYSRLTKMVRRKGVHTDDASDIVQDAYLRLTAALDRTDVRDPGAFLHTTAINLIRDRGRASSSRRHVIAPQNETFEHVACPTPSSEQAAISRQQLVLLEAALAELPPKRRAALVLYRFDDLTHAEIAQRLGISVSMVEKHVRLALNHCRQRMAQMNGDTHD